MSNDPNILPGLRQWAARVKPFPEQFVEVDFHRAFNRVQARKLLDGLVPRGREDRWFVLLRPSSLDFYRSGTGHHIYRLLVRDGPDGGLIAGPLLVNNDPEQFPGAHDASAARSVQRLIDLTLAFDPWAERY